MNKIAVMAATGFEDTELVATANTFAKRGIDFDIISIENIDKVKGKANIATVDAIHFKDVNMDDYAGIFIPGGGGHKLLLASDELKESIAKFGKEGKFLCAICAGPEVLRNAGVLEGKTATAHPGIGNAHPWTGKAFETDGNIVTGLDMFSTIVFAEEAAKVFNK